MSSHGDDDCAKRTTMRAVGESLAAIAIEMDPFQAVNVYDDGPDELCAIYHLSLARKLCCWKAQW